MEKIVKITSSKYLCQNVIQFRLEKPTGYTFIAGQATEISINRAAWIDKKSRLPSPVLLTILSWSLRSKYIRTARKALRKNLAG